MPSAKKEKRDTRPFLDELRTLRDEIRLHIHLGGKELRQEWEAIETRLPNVSEVSRDAKLAAAETTHSIMEEVRRVREKLAQFFGGRRLVRDIMAADVVTGRFEESLATVAGRMWDRDIGCIVIVGDDNDVTGIITDRDICIAAYTQGRPLAEMRVDSAMARSVHCCKETHTVEEAGKLMQAFKIRRLPVVDKRQRLLGIITLNDIARDAEQRAAHERTQDTEINVAETLAAIAEPRRRADQTRRAS